MNFDKNMNLEPFGSVQTFEALQMIRNRIFLRIIIYHLPLSNYYVLRRFPFYNANNLYWLCTYIENGHRARARAIIVILIMPFPAPPRHRNGATTIIVIIIIRQLIVELAKINHSFSYFTPYVHIDIIVIVIIRFARARGGDASALDRRPL